MLELKTVFAWFAEINDNKKAEFNLK